MSNPDAPSDRLRERAAQNRFKLWFLLSADRWAVTGSLALLVFAVLALSGLAVPGAERALRRADSVDTLFQGLLTATITGVTLVLTLNQLVLSQELGAVGDQRERMEEALDFRSDVADVVGAPAGPARPAQFLRALVETAADRARDLEAAAETEAGTADDRALEAVDDLVSSLRGNAEEVSAGLDGARFGAFDVLSSALDFNYSWKLSTARRIGGRHGDALSEETLSALEALIAVLELFGPAREHCKTLYFSGS
ncbi:MAG: hypothetical protein ABEJ59_04390 [Halanaeroarchaeum sp.]